ncbi:unnamed protein product [Sphenostylis stenocarpa]|uniref:Protein kinase domain-containing protein n=1 Tax=Sphenostylis stenocarpa TaxID=92480 RepID=A0AA86VB38_9FABA|nr:unnamed protein product [Sphenostylis stenocarpa]
MLALKLSLTKVLVVSIISIVSYASLNVEIEALKAFKNSITGDPNGALADWVEVTTTATVSLQLKGEISTFLGNISGLQVFDITSYSFTGYIPAQLTHLEYLLLFQNSLSGKIPSELAKCSKLLNLELYENQFTGSIPPELGNLFRLETLRLYHNNLNSTIPSSIFRLHGNLLEGRIPDKLSELKDLTKLLLHQNKLIGKIPDSISKLHMLSHLDLHGNKLNGYIPRSMGQLNHLLVLDLSHNQIRGPIPRDVIARFKNMQIYLNLSYNHLDGNVPAELGMLEMIQAIDISNNNLSGFIPRTLAGCRNLFNLDFSRNNVSGPIPAEAFSHMDLVESLNLSRNNLEGEIPEILVELDHLSSLDLSHNNLNGNIPEGFAKHSNLVHLNLSFNQLEGPVPTTGIFAHINASSIMGNQNLCGAKFLSPCEVGRHSPSKKGISIIAALGSLAILLFLVLVFLILNRVTKLRNSKERDISVNHGPEYSSALTLKRLNSKDLENATSFFNTDTIIGGSSLSTVYKGHMEDGRVVAFKRLNLQQFSANTDKIFKREVNTLSQMRHRNLVKVIGYAWETGKMKALILEYMENGNLDSIIHGKGVDQLVISRWTLSERVRVFISIASALDYLHSGYDFPIVHCDLKPYNILLDGQWEAHVSDFGAARILGLHLQDGSNLLSSAALQGTIGCMAPEFAYMRKVTTKADVFSFGIIVMEVLTKRRPTGLSEEDGLSITLREVVAKALANGIEKLANIVDPLLYWNVTQDRDEGLPQLIKLSLCCTLPDPEHRPNMNVFYLPLRSFKQHCPVK